MPSATLTQNSSNQSSTVPTPSASQPALDALPETSLGAAIQILERKVRNLEKRKSKLDGYRSDSQRGKELNDDQKSAIAKYDEVLQNLEFARELSVAFKTLKDDDDKSRKKALKKEQAEKAKMDVQRISQVLETQDLLWHVNKHRASKDFLNGGNGACKLSKDQLQHFEDFGKLVGGPSRKLHDPEYVKLLSSTSEHFINLMEGKESKKVGKTNYKELKGLFETVKSSGYFQTPHEEEERPKKLKNNGIEKQADKKTDMTNDAVITNNVSEPVAVAEPPKTIVEQPKVAAPQAVAQPAVFLPAESHEEKDVNHQPHPVQGHPRVPQPQPAQQHFPENISFYQSPVAFQESQLELMDPAVVKVQHSPPMMNIMTSAGPMQVPNSIPSQTFTNPIFIPPTTLAAMQQHPQMMPNFHGFPQAPQLIPQHPPQPTQPQQTQAPQPQQQQVLPPPQEQNHHGNFDFNKDANFERFRPDDGSSSQEQEGNRQPTPPHDTMANIDDWNNGMEPSGNGDEGQGKGPGGWRGRGGRGRGGSGRGGPRDFRDGNRSYRGDRERDGNYRGDRDRDRENGNYRGDREGNYRGDREGNYRGDREGNYRGDRDRGGRGSGERRGGNRPPRGEGGGYRGGNGNGPRGGRPTDSSRGGRGYAPKQNGHEETN